MTVRLMSLTANMLLVGGCVLGTALVHRLLRRSARQRWRIRLPAWMFGAALLLIIVVVGIAIEVTWGRTTREIPLLVLEGVAVYLLGRGVMDLAVGGPDSATDRSLPFGR